MYQHVGSLQIVFLSPSLHKSGICVPMLVMNGLCHWPFLAFEGTTWSHIWRYLYIFSPQKLWGVTVITNVKKETGIYQNPFVN